MCLAVPARIKTIDASSRGTVDHMGVEVAVDFSLLPDSKKGDWVIVHAGFAISCLDPDEARETLKLFRDIARAGGQ